MRIIPMSLGQNTAAARLLFQKGMGTRTRSNSPRGKRKTIPRAPTKRRASAARPSRRPARLVKGSMAAKRYMASIRKKRR